MTYGFWLDRAAADLRAAAVELRGSDPPDVAEVWRVVALRDGVTRQLTRLALMVDSVSMARREAVPVSARTLAAVSDPAVATLLRALPVPVGNPLADDGASRTLAAAMVQSATAGVSTAADILASHVDPINGPRTPEGAAVRIGAGRLAAIGDIADVALELAHVAEALLTWVGRNTPAPVRHHLVLHQALTAAATITDAAELTALAENSRHPAVIRQLDVATAPTTHSQPRTPATVTECVSIIDEFRAWAFRSPEQATGRHLSAAIQVGAVIAFAATQPESHQHRTWRDMTIALGDIAVRPPRNNHDVRSAEFGHVADLIQSQHSGIDHTDLAALANLLQPLAGTLDSMTRRLISNSALMSKHITLDRSAQRAGVVPATGRWTAATLASPPVLDLLAAYEAILDLTDQPVRPPAGRAFRPIGTVGRTARPKVHDQQTPARARPRQR